MGKESLLSDVRIEDPFFVANLEDFEVEVPIISLEELEKRGCWITEVFGTDAYVVYPYRNGFNCVVCHIDFNGCEQKCLKHIKLLAQHRLIYWRKYLGLSAKSITESFKLLPESKLFNC